MLVVAAVVVSRVFTRAKEATAVTSAADLELERFDAVVVAAE
jgi:hypothetical protein